MRWDVGVSDRKCDGKLGLAMCMCVHVCVDVSGGDERWVLCAKWAPVIE